MNQAVRADSRWALRLEMGLKGLCTFVLRFLLHVGGD